MGPARTDPAQGQSSETRYKEGLVTPRVPEARMPLHPFAISSSFSIFASILWRYLDQVDPAPGATPPNQEAANRADRERLSAYFILIPIRSSRAWSTRIRC